MKKIRNLEKLAFRKNFMIPNIKIGKTDFYIEGYNEKYQITLEMGNRFKKDILPYIPEIIVCGGVPKDSFEVIEKVWDCDIETELGEINTISIEEWAAEAAALVLFMKVALKTNSRPNVSYVRLPDGRVSVMRIRFQGNKWFFSSYMFNKGKQFEWEPGTLVIAPPIIY